MHYIHYNLNLQLILNENILLKVNVQCQFENHDSHNKNARIAREFQINANDISAATLKPSQCHRNY
jgi:hypothetical protein